MCLTSVITFYTGIHYFYHNHKIILFLSAMREFANEMTNNGFDIHYFKPCENCLISSVGILLKSAQETFTFVLVVLLKTSG